MRRSLLWHGKIGADLREDMPDVTTRQCIFSGLEQIVPSQWELPKDFMQFTHFLRVIQDLDFGSTPGYPYRNFYPTNADFFGYRNGVFTNSDRLQEIWQMMEFRIRERISDPIYLFIKPEPHKLSKKGRKRIISSVSIMDQLVDQMLFGDYNEILYEDSAMGSVKAGWNVTAGGWKAMPKIGISLDKTAWDWTVKPWLLQMCLEFRRMRLKSDPGNVWWELASWRYAALFSQARFALPSGAILKQAKPGVMKSGCVNTIIDNSLMQIILHLRVCHDMGIDPGWIWSLGDDTRQSIPDNLQEYLDRVGQFSVVKEATTSCEFAGCRFDKGYIEPLYKGKHAFIMLHCDPNIQEDIARSYSLLYHRSKDRKKVLGILDYLGKPLPESFLDYLWDGEG